MQQRTYSEIRDEVKRQWDNEGVNNRTEFQKEIASIMRDVYESGAIKDNTSPFHGKDSTFNNKFYSAVFKEYKKRH